MKVGPGVYLAQGYADSLRKRAAEMSSWASDLTGDPRIDREWVTKEIISTARGLLGLLEALERAEGVLRR